MRKMKNNPDIVKATSEGRLYISSVDFFNQEKIQALVTKLKDSRLIKDIDKKNKKTVGA